MDNKEQVRDFLQSRRARLRPQSTGLATGGRRRVPGLRREEVALLANISTDYYVRMERGNLAGVSVEVLSAVASALQLNETEADHLHDLASAFAPPRRSSARKNDGAVRESVQLLLHAITGAPAWVINASANILAINDLGRALLSPLLARPENRGNTARFIYLDPASRSFYPDWEGAATNSAASLRLAAGRNPHDKDISDLVGELITRSETFAERWAMHNVRLHRTGTKRLHHPDVGDMQFSYEGLELPDRPGCVLFAYAAQPGSPTADRLQLLGTLAATTAADASTAEQEA